MSKRNSILLIILILVLFLLMIFNVQCTLIKDISHEILKSLKNLGEPAEYSNISRTGKITSNEIWSGEIYVTGDITVENRVALTILPGTKIIFAAHSDDQKCGVDIQP